MLEPDVTLFIAANHDMGPSTRKTIGHTGLLRKELSAGLLVKPFAPEIESRKCYALTAPEIARKPAVATLWEWLEAQSF